MFSKEFDLTATNPQDILFEIYTRLMCFQHIEAK